MEHNIIKYVLIYMRLIQQSLLFLYYGGIYTIQPIQQQYLNLVYHNIIASKVVNNFSIHYI